MSGILWFTLFIPFILIGVLLGIPKLRKMTKWWELAIPIAITILVVVICQWIAIRSAISDKEYWGHLTSQAIHEEPFSYDGECSRQDPCGQSCDSEGNCTTTYCTVYYHCIKTSSRKAYIIHEAGTYTGQIRISYSKYKELVKRWNNHEHVAKKIITKDAHYTTVGDKYNRPGRGSRHWVFWPKTWETAEPVVSEHTYENRLQTQSHWGKVSEEDRNLYDVFEYPSVPGGWRLQSLLTNGPAFRETDKYLQYLNGYLNTTEGGYKKVRLWLLVYFNQPQESAELQRAHWKGGNKNEIVVMLGMNDEKEITWSDIMSHSDESDTLMINVRDTLLLEMAGGKNGYSGKLTDKDMLKFVHWYGDAVKSGYTKPDFGQYNYIQVSPSLFAIILTYIIVLVVNIGAGIFVVYNPWYEEAHRPIRSRRTGNYRYR